jgi:hypothetical protein
VNALTPLADDSRVAGPHEPVDEMIARVLGGAHRGMEAFDAPNEARTILHVAHSFADELAAVDPRFDRLQFMRDVMDDPA